ncbi:MAG: sulfatase-like hydrolase/transferase [Planctomycetota bacterium]|jgi:arylsulfatase A-like enzyme|nr:sulfatase-like hydrolase/transferase [Planctomycetota bacterium]MDP6942093.1 sulfatase-like hydrolase/transferase [Planctomycetota bacterium]
MNILKFIFFFLSGLALMGVVQSLGGMGSRAVNVDFGLRDSISVCVGGNILTGLVLALLISVYCLLRRKQPQAPSTGFWAGTALGCAPLISFTAQEFFNWSGNPSSGIWASIPLFLFAPILNRKLSIKPMVSGGILLASLFLWSAAFWGWVPSINTETAQVGFSESDKQVSEQTPDVVLISIDTIRADAMLGPNSAHTPNFISLIEKGLWAEAAISPSNQTIPGHAGMLTGLGTGKLGLLDNSYAFPTSVTYLPEYFQKGGWNTSAVVSNGLLARPTGPSMGFDHYSDEVVLESHHIRIIRALEKLTLIGWITGTKDLEAIAKVAFYSDGSTRFPAEEQDLGLGYRTTDKALNSLEALSTFKSPYFFFLHYMDPHDPYNAPDEFAQTRPRNANSGTVLGIDFPAYLEEVDFLDAQLGKVLEAIQAKKRPTIIAITGDHGEFFLEHNLTGHRKHVFEEVLQVPFVLHGPGIPHKKLDEAFLEDIAPTLLARCGFDISSLDFDGVNLLDNPSVGRIHVARDTNRIAIRQGDWKWITELDKSGTPIPSRSGFVNLKNDPKEKNWPSSLPGPKGFDVAIQFILEELKATVGKVDLTENRKELLEQLGYGDLLVE